MARITAFASQTLPAESVTCLTLPVRSTASASSVISVAPNFSAWERILPIRSGPITPSGKPGKFSTSVVFISAPPPSRAPSKTMGFSAARAA